MVVSRNTAKTALALHFRYVSHRLRRRAIERGWGPASTFSVHWRL